MQAEFCFPQGFSFPFGISGKSEIVLVGFFFFFQNSSGFYLVLASKAT